MREATKIARDGKAREEETWQEGYDQVYEDGTMEAEI